MADDIASLQYSLAEIKLLLENKKKEKGEAVTAEVFTDPRFIEIFENYFRPLVDSSKEIKGRLTEKRKISVFDVIGISERTQETKRNALTKELDKLTEKVRGIAKSIGTARHYNLSDVLGLTKTERAMNRRIVNNAIRALSLSIHQTAKNLSDPNVVMKFIGLKPIKMPKSIEFAKVPAPIPTPPAPVITPEVEAPVVIDETPKPKRGRKKTAVPPVTTPPATPAILTTVVPPPVVPKPGTGTPPAVPITPTTAPSRPVPPTVPASPTAPSTPTRVGVTPPPATAVTPNVPVPGVPTATLAQQNQASHNVVKVAIVDIQDDIKDWFEKVMAKAGGGGAGDKGVHTGTDRESYSHSANAIARLLTLGAGLLALGIPTLIKGLFDQGPLKGVEKMVSSYSLQLAGKLGKGVLHYIGNFFPKIMKGISQAFSGELGISAAKSFVKRGVLGKAAARMLGFLGKIAKKIPGLGMLISLGFAFNRFANGDIQGGLIDLASGAASTIPIVGTAVSIGLDLINAQADLATGKVSPQKKGWLGKFNDFISKWFSRLILFQLNKLPFGLGKKVAGWMGLNMEGIVDTAMGDEGSDKAINPVVDKANSKIKNAQEVRVRAESRKKEILNGRQVDELSDTERVEYDKQEATVERADKSIEDQTNIVRGATVKKPAAGPKTPEERGAFEAPEKRSDTKTESKAEQTPTAAAENDNNQNDVIAHEEAIAEASMRVERPYTPTPVPTAPKEDEAVNTLKQINANLENMNAKTPQPSQQGNNAPFVNVSSIVGGQGGGGGGSALQFAIESTRDTCYNSRERTRNMIMDYRGIA